MTPHGRTARSTEQILSSPSNSESDSVVSQEKIVEHFVARSVPVLFVSRQGLHLRKLHSLRPSGSASYVIQFCDHERWSSHLKLASVGLTPDRCSTIETSGSSESNNQTANANLIRFVEESKPTSIDERFVAKNAG